MRQEDGPARMTKEDGGAKLTLFPIYREAAQVGNGRNNMNNINWSEAEIPPQRDKMKCHRFTDGDEAKARD